MLYAPTKKIIDYIAANHENWFKVGYTVTNTVRQGYSIFVSGVIEIQGVIYGYIFEFGLAYPNLLENIVQWGRYQDTGVYRNGGIGDRYVLIPINEVKEESEAFKNYCKSRSSILFKQTELKINKYLYLISDNLVANNYYWLVPTDNKISRISDIPEHYKNYL